MVNTHFSTQPPAACKYILNSTANHSVCLRLFVRLSFCHCTSLSYTFTVCLCLSTHVHQFPSVCICTLFCHRLFVSICLSLHVCLSAAYVCLCTSACHLKLAFLLCLCFSDSACLMHVFYVCLYLFVTACLSLSTLHFFFNFSIFLSLYFTIYQCYSLSVTGFVLLLGHSCGAVG